MIQPQLENTNLRTVQQTPGLLDTYLEEHSDDPELIAESLAINITEDAVRLLQNKGILRSDLAELMNVSRAYVTKLFNAPPNLTLLSIARLGVALGVKPYIGLSAWAPVDFEVKRTQSGVTYEVNGKIVPHHYSTSSTGVMEVLLEPELDSNILASTD